MEFCIYEIKANNLIVTKLQFNLLNNRNTKINILFSTLHNSMTKLCCALSKYKNETKPIEIIDLQHCSSLKLYEMQEKGTSWDGPCLQIKA